MLGRLREKGINYVFVSNSDNLGATLDLDLLAYFAQSGNGFLMEVRPSTISNERLICRWFTRHLPTPRGAGDGWCAFDEGAVEVPH
jgi:UTP--glucose-1-phosphate uridylyltransferase